MIENFMKRKVLFSMLSMIYYRAWKDCMTEESFHNAFKHYVDKLQELGLVEKDDWTNLTKEGLFQMDNNYVVGRISFVLLVKRLLKTSENRVISLISRALNIILHPSKEDENGRNEMFEEIISFITPANLVRIKKAVDARIQQMNSASIIDENVLLHIRELRASAGEKHLPGSSVVTRLSPNQ